MPRWCVEFHCSLEVEADNQREAFQCALNEVQQDTNEHLTEIHIERIPNPRKGSTEHEHQAKQQEPRAARPATNRTANGRAARNENRGNAGREHKAGVVRATPAKRKHGDRLRGK